jgi:hypothetical protein
VQSFRFVFFPRDFNASPYHRMRRSLKMPSKSKSVNAAALLAAGIPRRSWSKAEFCARHGISEGLYDKLKKLGLGPDETELLNRVIITDTAEDKWLEERAAASENI